MKKSPTLNLVNELTPTYCASFVPGEALPGQFYAANASMFSDAHFSQPLTTYSQGFGNANPEVDMMLEWIAPAIQVPFKFSYRKPTGAEYFLSETDDIRAVGADFGIVRYTSAIVNDRVQNKGLTIVEDQDEVSDEPGWEQDRVNRMIKRLTLNDFRRAAVLLKAAATNDAQTWDGSTGTYGPDPDMGALSRVMAGNAEIGAQTINRGLYGITAWQKRTLSHRKVSTAGGFASAAMTPTEVARLIGLDDIKVSREIYISTGTTRATVMDTTIGTTGIALFYAAQSGQSKDDPSNIKRFWTPCKDGSRFRVYRQEFAKTVAITVEHYSKITITNADGPQQITVS